MVGEVPSPQVRDLDQCFLTFTDIVRRCRTFPDTAGRPATPTDVEWASAAVASGRWEARCPAVSWVDVCTVDATRAAIRRGRRRPGQQKAEAARSQVRQHLIADPTAPLAQTGLGRTERAWPPSWHTHLLVESARR